MKKFLVNITIILLLSLGVAALFQAAISYRIKGKSINGKDNFHTIMNQQNDIVFLGSSRCTEHFDPHFFRDSLGINSVNLGVSGHGDLTMQFIKLTCYLHDNPPPKIAMLNFDPISTYGPYDVSKNENFIEKHFFARYAFWPQGDDTTIVKYFHFNTAEKYIPLFALLRYRSITECLNMWGAKSWNKYGYEPQTTNWDTVNFPTDTRYFFTGYPKYISSADSIEAHLATFNELCKSNHIKLVCVQSTVYKNIYDNEAYSVIGKICSDLGIFFIDANDESIRSDVRNFADASHLNTTGVPKMLNIIIKNQGFLDLLHSGAPSK